MNTSAESSHALLQQCPVCDAPLRVESFRSGETVCAKCGHVIWYQKRTVDGAAIMDAISGIVAINTDIERVSKSLVAGPDKARVILNLSQLKFISSAFVAGMIALQKRIRAADGRLILCEMHPIVRETLHGARLDTYFEICDTEKEALNSLS